MKRKKDTLTKYTLKHKQTNENTRQAKNCELILCYCHIFNFSVFDRPKLGFTIIQPVLWVNHKNKLKLLVKNEEKKRAHTQTHNINKNQSMKNKEWRMRKCVRYTHYVHHYDCFRMPENWLQFHLSYDMAVFVQCFNFMCVCVFFFFTHQPSSNLKSLSVWDRTHKLLSTHQF